MILISTESPWNLKSAHANEGAIEGHHVGEMIICFMRLHDDFADFFSDFARFSLMVSLITKFREKKEHYYTYLSYKNH